MTRWKRNCDLNSYAMVAAGQSSAIAEILATQTCPGFQTDKRFMSGRGDNSFYSHQLQENVSSRADVKRICAEKNYDCEAMYWDAGSLYLLLSTPSA